MNVGLREREFINVKELADILGVITLEKLRVTLLSKQKQWRIKNEKKVYNIFFDYTIFIL